MNQRLETLLSHTVEAVLARWPHAAPLDVDLARARVVSHRGERDGVRVLENTVAAFEPAIDAGVDAIEFDIRYTRDNEPVVIHDADLKRVFGLGERVADTDWRTLKQRVPRLPHLTTLIERFAPHTHLMIELKTRGNAHAEQRLVDCLAGLRPVDDFHMLSLDTDLFAGVTGLPADCHLPVAKFNYASLHDWALTHTCAGLAGPYALIRNRHIRELTDHRGFVGSGFVENPALLMREIARGVGWIFSNNAVRLQRALDGARSSGIS